MDVELDLENDVIYLGDNKINPNNIYYIRKHNEVIISVAVFDSCDFDEDNDKPSIPKKYYIEKYPVSLDMYKEIEDFLTASRIKNEIKNKIYELSESYRLFTVKENNNKKKLIKIAYRKLFDKMYKAIRNEKLSKKYCDKLFNIIENYCENL